MLVPNLWTTVYQHQWQQCLLVLCLAVHHQPFISDYLYCFKDHPPDIVSLERPDDAHRELHIFPAVVVLVGVPGPARA